MIPIAAAPISANGKMPASDMEDPRVSTTPVNVVFHISVSPKLAPCATSVNLPIRRIPRTRETPMEINIQMAVIGDSAPVWYAVKIASACRRLFASVMRWTFFSAAFKTLAAILSVNMILFHLHNNLYRFHGYI